ncbi:type 1 glutamine amidotransferase family protein [Vibrio sp. VB16]|uniref:type 1 glutamine amidotransferase family protein n=1 Tax=Vibrio sp. VB16 TaxID=2785746 RepID=UPI0018A0EEBC|nr:type 1 glutamine amidotransferase family protein [Vibrio sp. VB16]UGA53394.1 glutamine amidotransferase [Vibrio sp. VB16]
MKMKTVHLCVYNTMADWEYGYVIAHINSPDFQKNPNIYEIKTVGMTLEPIRTKGGIQILPDMSLAQLSSEDSQLLILAGSDNAVTGGIDDFVTCADNFLKHGTPVAAICGATAALARAGLLNKLRHTSNAKAFLDGEHYSGSENYSEVPAITDGNLITASGLAPVEFAVEIFRKLDLYSETTLNSWLMLFQHQDPMGFYNLMEEHSK